MRTATGRLTRTFAAARTSKDESAASPKNPTELRQHNQVRVYIPDQNINLIIRESKSGTKNKEDKEIHIRLLKNAALGLAKNYKKDAKKIKEATINF